MISPAQRVRSLAALVSMLFLVIGVPWALVTFGGNPFGSSGLSPSRWSEPLGTEALLSVLVLVMWLAWLHFVVSLVLEFKGARRHDTGRGTLAATSHPLARRLVASVLLLAGSLAVTVPAAQAAEMPGHSSIAVSRVVSDGENVGAVAAQELDARTALAETEKATAGEVKRELALSYKVKPPHARHHDSLWDIAERTLGDGRRWTELYDLNKNRVQDDGTRLQDADLIYPGWELLMPDDATGPDIRDARPATPAPDPGASDIAPAPQPGAEPAPAESSTGATTASDAEPAGSLIGSSLAAPLGTFAGLVAAGLLLGLRRRRQWNGGGDPGRGTAVEDEMSLQLAANTPQAAFVDRAMRHLGTHLDQRRPSAPMPHTCRAGSETLSVSFTSVPDQNPPPGWRVLGDGRVWAVDRNSLEATDVESALPHLVTVGVDNGDQVLLNLDRGGSPLALGGDAERIQALLRSVVVDLATHAWSDDLCVLVVGLGDDLGALASPRLHQVRDVAAVAPVAEALDPRLPVAVVVAQPLSETDLSALVGWVRDRTGTTSLLHPARPDQPHQLELGHSGRLTSRSLGLFAEAVGVSSTALQRLMALYAAEPRRTAHSATEDVTGFASRLLDPTARTTASVRLLGPLDVRGAGEVVPERLAAVREVITYLALHPEGAHRHVLAAAVWPRGVQDDVFDSTMAHVARFLDPAPAENEEDAPASVLLHADGRWMLDQSEVRIDWQVFRAHLALAAGSADSYRHLDDALDLVAGPPLGDLDAGRFAWLAGSSTETDVNVAVVHAVEQLSDLCVVRGDVHAARGALRRGLTGVPACEPLWQRLLRLSADDDTELRLVADEMYAAIARQGSPLGATAETDALVHELAPDYVVPQRGRSLTA